MPKKVALSPSIDNKSSVIPCGYIRRKEAANYLGISSRTLSNWQSRRIIPFVKVGHRLALFRIADLDRAMKRFTVNAVGED